jgi:HlyD family secretion protein
MDKKGTALKVGIVCVALVVLYYIWSAWYHHNDNQTLYGNVDIRDVNLGFRVTGRLLDLNVDEGDTVHRGELLGRLDPDPYQREVRAAEAAVKQQKAALAYAETVYAREKKLFGTGASSTDHYQNALSLRDEAIANLDRSVAELSQSSLRLQDTYLFSPSDGVVLTRAVEPGTMLPVNATVLGVTLINPVWVRAYVAETMLAKAKPGTSVKVTSDSLPDKSYDGIIGFVSPTAEFTPKPVETTDLRTQLVYRLRIIVQDPSHQLRQGMPVTVVLLAQKPK